MKNKQFSAARLVRRAVRRHFPGSNIRVSHDVTEKGVHVASTVAPAIDSVSAERLRARFNHPNGRAEIRDFPNSTHITFEYTPVVRVKR